MACECECECESPPLLPTHTDRGAGPAPGCSVHVFAAEAVARVEAAAQAEEPFFMYLAWQVGH